METRNAHISFSAWKRTITLEDVTLQLGLKIDGLPITSVITNDVRVACHALLGDTPPDKYIKGKSIYLSWLRQKFKQLPVDTDDNVVSTIWFHSIKHVLQIWMSSMSPCQHDERSYWLLMQHTWWTKLRFQQLVYS